MGRLTMNSAGRPLPPVRVGEEFYRQIADLIARREALVVVTVAEASGSAPGKPGAKMIVTRSGQYGTVGGGEVEKAALEKARELLGQATAPEFMRYNLVQDLGMTCGGQESLLYEPISLAPRLVIFGAGHVARSLCAMAALAGFDLTVCDEREDWLTTAAFPAARERILAEPEEAVERARLDADTFVAVATPSHPLDERVVCAILGRDPKPRYLGVIGSRRKRELFRRGLIERGSDGELAQLVRTPMGLNIGAADPKEIAVSVVAELVAVLRGVERVEPW